MRISFKLLTLLLLLSFTSGSFAQVAVSAPLHIASAIFGGGKAKKKEKVIKRSVSQVEINGATVSVLRVKDADIISDAKDNIIKVQNQLDGYAQQYKNKEHLSIPPKDKDINAIMAQDSDWPTEYYLDEYNAYKKYEKKLEASDQLIKKDSTTKASIAPQAK